MYMYYVCPNKSISNEKQNKMSSESFTLSVTSLMSA